MSAEVISLARLGFSLVNREALFGASAAQSPISNSSAGITKKQRPFFRQIGLRIRCRYFVASASLYSAPPSAFWLT